MAKLSMKKPPKKKPAPKQKWTRKPSYLWATKTRKSKVSAWMPDTVAVNLEGEKTGKLLMVCGWSTAVARQYDIAWPADRIEVNMDRIKKTWTEDYGHGWRLEIRS